ncbi:MAG: hypothetical protein AAFO07_10105 [Bacteroidota bacterium]
MNKPKFYFISSFLISLLLLTTIAYGNSFHGECDRQLKERLNEDKMCEITVEVDVDFDTGSWRMAKTGKGNLTITSKKPSCKEAMDDINYALAHL